MNAELAHHRRELDRINDERQALARRYRDVSGALNTAYEALGHAEARDGIAAITALKATLRAVSSPRYREYVAADAALYEEGKPHVKAVKAALRARRQARANERKREATYAAACSCGLVHAGECY